MTGRPMRDADAAWLHMDRPTNRAIINAVLWFEQPVGVDALREVLRERLAERYPAFRRLAVGHGALGGAVWRDDVEFNLDRHLHHVALPAPGDQDALQRLVGDLASTPLDRDKPLWDAYLVDGYGRGSALVLRVHHCVADGIALARVLLTMTDAEPSPDGRRRHEPSTGGEPEPRGFVAALLGGGLHATSMVARAATGLLAHPGRIAELASEAVADARSLAKLTLSPGDPETAIRGELGRSTAVAWTEPFALADVKAIARHNGATINDVLVSAVAGALGTYLAAGDVAAEDIHALVPFNLRPLDEPPSPELGNHFGLVLLELPLSIVDRADRVREIHERMMAVKRSRDGAVSYAIVEAMGAAPVAAESALIDFFTAKASLVLTNVPGPREPVVIAGRRVGGVLVWAPCAGTVSMSVSIFSYAGSVSVGFLVDEGLVPNAGRLAALVGDELRAERGLPARRHRT